MKPRFLCAAALAIASPLAAHHSFAMFDMTKTVALSGTIKEVHWSNPHVWIDLVAVQNGKPVPWGIEAGATGTLMRQGWKKDSVKPGDKVTIHIHPLRNGQPSGSMVKVVLPDGRVLELGAQGARPA